MELNFQIWLKLSEISKKNIKGHGVALASVAVAVASVVFSDNKAYPHLGSGPLAFDFDFSWGVAINKIVPKFCLWSVLSNSCTIYMNCSLTVIL